MRKPFVAGNWKMNKTVAQAKVLVGELLPSLQAISSVEIVLCPPFPALMAISSVLNSTGVGLGAQNIFWESSGAYTGEISPEMVKEFCQYVILGHSERRTYFGETDATVNKRLKAALANQLFPIVCIGETLSENESNQTHEVITRQVYDGLAGLTKDEASRIVIAYEPVWAIGTGRPSTGAGANMVVGVMIRPAIEFMFGKEIAQSVRVLYGGSVNAKNASEFFIQPDIDGALVGGASLKSADFIGIVEAAAGRA